MVWLVGQMWILLAVAALLGMIIGCWICSRQPKNDGPDLDVEVAKLRSRSEESNAERVKLRARISELETELKTIAKAQAVVPTFYDSPSDGDPDDLKKIKGVGPKLEELLHSLGVYYYRQIAGWDNAQVAEVDNKLTFKGRILRDDWRSQAKVLADGGETEFGNRYDKGET